MEYRDERATLERKVERLESELAEARATIARLEGRDADLALPEGHDRITGAPRLMRIRRELPFAISTSGYEAIAELLRERLSAGQVSQVGRTLTFRMNNAQIVLAREGAQTVITTTVTHGHRRVQLLAGAPGLALLASILSAAPLLGLGLPPQATAAIVPIAVVALFAWLRGRIGQGVREENELLAGVTEAIVDLAREHRIGRRVEVEGEDRIETSDALGELEEEAVEAEAELTA